MATPSGYWPYQPNYQPYQPPPPPKKSHKATWWVIGIFGAIAAAGIATGIIVAAQPDDITITGVIHVELADNDGLFTTSIGDCTVSSGYSDLDVGGQVEVLNGKGELIAAGRIVNGFPNTGDGYCELSFAVDGIPAGEELYSVAVGNDNRGQLSYTEEELAQMDYSVDIGF